MGSDNFQFKIFLLVILLVGTSLFAAEKGYNDSPFWQDSAVKYKLPREISHASLQQVRCDRNGVIHVLSSAGILKPYKHQLIRDNLHRPLSAMSVRALASFDSQLIYLTDREIFSNGWAGTFYTEHRKPEASLFCMRDKFEFLLLDNKQIIYFDDEENIWSKNLGSIKPIEILYDKENAHFYILTAQSLYLLDPDSQVLTKSYSGRNFTSMTMTAHSKNIVIGTEDGYFAIHPETGKLSRQLERELPSTQITCVSEIDGDIWFGTTHGAFAVTSENTITYYASRRWLSDNNVIDIAPGPDKSVLILTSSGLSHIDFNKITLADKAKHFERLTRKRHIRYGFNSKFQMSETGDFSTGTLVDQDNDGLWTSMYLAGEIFRYAVTSSEDALENCYESFQAIERLETITPLYGFPARSFERSGYQKADKQRWRPVGDGQWDWKATTSSDEIVGHFFASALFAEVIPDRRWRQRAIKHMERIMDHIITNDWYLIDFDGKPTRWGRWHPEYINQFPSEVGDRRLNSIEIIAFLQTTYHFTQQDIYKRKAYELLETHGYLENIMIPISSIGRVDGINLSSEWNHSDDELAFLSYWNLYKYAFTKELQEKYRRIIQEHWEIERPEKIPLWNFIYRATGADNFDLEESIWFLKEFPLDMVDWSIQNSHRQDINKLNSNFRGQTISAVLPPDERPLAKYNGNAFRLDSEGRGLREYSGDIFLLPYWMGRYLGIIE